MTRSRNIYSQSIHLWFIMILLNVFIVYLLWLFVASKLFSETTNDSFQKFKAVWPFFTDFGSNSAMRCSLGEVYIVSAVELWTASLAPTFGVPTGNTVQVASAPATIQWCSMQKQKDAPGKLG